MRSSERNRRPSAGLLSPSTYNDDAASLRSISDQDSDSEDDQVIRGTRTTFEIAEHDRTVSGITEHLYGVTENMLMYDSLSSKICPFALRASSHCEVLP